MERNEVEMMQNGMRKFYESGKADGQSETLLQVKKLIEEMKVPEGLPQNVGYNLALESLKEKLAKLE